VAAMMEGEETVLVLARLVVAMAVAAMELAARAEGWAGAAIAEVERAEGKAAMERVKEAEVVVREVAVMLKVTMQGVGEVLEVARTEVEKAVVKMAEEATVLGNEVGTVEVARAVARAVAKAMATMVVVAEVAWEASQLPHAHVLG